LIPCAISAFQASKILAAYKAGKQELVSSLDLNRTRTTLRIDASGVHLPSGSVVSWVSIEKVIEEDRKVFLVDGEEVTAIHVYSETTGWVRTLCPSASAPTVLVSGFPMHRIKDCDPVKDTEAKMRAFGKVRGRVLDTATGLGYTAIAAAKAASEVVTIELDPAALEIARFNPWSAELFSLPNITQILSDAFEEVLRLEAGSFSGILHDPPTFALAGELYSGEFYRRLRRLLKRGGALFHYIGDPESGHGKKHFPGVTRRLNESGFERVRVAREAFGVTAVAS